jgi:outer membrane protein TolC
MPRAARGFAVVVTMAAIGTARAEHTLTLDDALALARTHNRDLRQGRARLAESELGVAVARSALLPQVVSQGKYTHNYKEVSFDFTGFQRGIVGLAEVIRTTTTEPALATALQAYEDTANAAIAHATPIEIQLSEQLDASISASVPLIAPSAWYSLSAARRTAESSSASYQVTEATVLVGVAQAYFAAAGTDELVGARQDAIRVAEETYQVAKTRTEAKVASVVDLTRAETALVRAKQDLAEAENARGAAYRALATLIGTHDELRVVPTATAPRELGDAEALVHEAIAARPEMTADRAAIAAARASSDSAAWRWSPTLSAWGNAHVGNYTGFSGDKYSWAVGVELDWVLYDGGLRDAQRHIADAQRVEAEARLELAADTISDEVANARGTVDTKRKGVVAADHAVELAKQTLGVVRVQYEAGTATQLDLLQAQDSLVTAQVAVAQAHFDLSLADLQLSRAIGQFPSRPYQP